MGPPSDANHINKPEQVFRITGEKLPDPLRFGFHSRFHQNEASEATDWRQRREILFRQFRSQPILAPVSSCSGADGSSLPAMKSASAGARPTSGYRKIAALLKRERRSDGLPPINLTRVYRLMKKHCLLLERHIGHRPREHNG